MNKKVETVVSDALENLFDSLLDLGVSLDDFAGIKKLLSELVDDKKNEVLDAIADAGYEENQYRMHSPDYDS